MVSTWLPYLPPNWVVSTTGNWRCCTCCCYGFCLDFDISSVLNQRSIMISWRKSKPKTNKLGCHPFESCNVTSFWEVKGHGSLEGRLIIETSHENTRGDPSRKRSIRSVISKVTLDYSDPELLKPSKKKRSEPHRSEDQQVLTSLKFKTSLGR